MPPNLKKPVSWRLWAKATSPRTPSASPSARNSRASSSTVQLGSLGSAFLLRQNAAICAAVASALPMIAVFPSVSSLSGASALLLISASFAATFALNSAQRGRM